MFEAIRNVEVSPVDIGVLIGYFLLMIAVGYACRKASVNISDYIRMGNKGSWWVIGLSIFMQAVSAITFTSNCGQAYLAGWSVLLLSVGGITGLLVQGFFMAGWMRKTRAITPADAIRLRFGPVMEQIFVYVGVTSSMLWGGVFLYSLASFMSAIFNLPITGVIFFAGIVVVIYSVSGGSWSVMITDSLQSLILVPICLVLAFLSLQAVGGFSGLFEAIHAQGLSEDFQFLVPADHVYQETAGKVKKGFFTTGWLSAAFMFGVITSVQMNQCHRFLSAKDENVARKAAFFAAGLLLIGSLIWYIPPIVGRVLYEADVEALAEVANQTLAEGEIARASLKNPAEGAYAVIAKKLLPPGLLGLMITAMFAAAMSSIDSFLTGTAGLVGNNIMPPLMRKMGKEPLTGLAQLRFTKGVNLALGAWAMCLAYILKETDGGGGIFNITQMIILLVAGPMGLPYALAFFVKRLPSWAPVFGMSCGMIVSAVFMFGPKLGFEAVSGLLWHEKMYISVPIVLISTYLTTFFWKKETAPVFGFFCGMAVSGGIVFGPANHLGDFEKLFITVPITLFFTYLIAPYWKELPEYKKQVDTFFVRLNTPVDYKSEVGETDDHSQLILVGKLGLVTAGLILCLLFFVRGTAEMLSVVFVSAFIGSITGAMYFKGRKISHREHGRSVVPEAE